VIPPNNNTQLFVRFGHFTLVTGQFIQTLASTSTPHWANQKRWQRKASTNESDDILIYQTFYIKEHKTNK
jgi:hypothetical protein